LNLALGDVERQHADQLALSGWREPDEGIWEVRGPRRHFIHSKVMAWMAFDRAVKTIERFGVPGPIDRWKRLRSEIHGDICRNGYDAVRGTFTQYYGSKELDASVLAIPMVGFLPLSDRRVVSTVEVLQRELTRDGFLLRYSTDESDDGLPGSEGAFLPCSFLLANSLALIGRRQEAVELYERLLGLRNDLGLISEEYDVHRRRQVGNFPQAFTHLAVINTASVLDGRHPAAAQARASEAAVTVPRLPHDTYPDMEVAAR
jgi:GH15 family glucan-1,4-alpha-glucosidase